MTEFFFAASQKAMRILAIDTALEACSVVLMDGDSVIARQHQMMARGHAEALMPMIAQLRDETTLDFASLDRVAVTVGPGSFTGLRVGIAAARGIGLAAQKPVIGVSTLEAFTAPLIASEATSPVAAAIDARHGHVYFQIFGTDGDDMVSATIMPIAQAIELAAPLTPRLVGNAASILAAAWPENATPPHAVMQQAAPDIDWVARLGLLADPASSPPKPLYLKPADAQPQTGGHIPLQATAP